MATSPLSLAELTLCSTSSSVTSLVRAESLFPAEGVPFAVLLTLEGFVPRQASVFQVARAPGQKLVYLGALLLIVGVFAMLYVKERRLWVWIAPSADMGGSQVRMAMSSTRATSLVSSWRP